MFYNLKKCSKNSVGRGSRASKFCRKIFPQKCGLLTTIVKHLKYFSTHLWKAEYIKYDLIGQKPK